MPLPNYGYFNKEDRKSQELAFEMPPELIDEKGEPGKEEDFLNSEKSIRGQITTGKLCIDLERKMVVHADKDREIWRAPDIDPRDVEDAKKFASPHRQHIRRDVKSSIDSLISGDKLRQLRSSKRPGLDQGPDLLSSYSGGMDDQAVRFSVPRSRSRSGSQPRQETHAGLSIQPRGTYKLQQYSSSQHVKSTTRHTPRQLRGY